MDWVSAWQGVGCRQVSTSVFPMTALYRKQLVLLLLKVLLFSPPHEPHHFDSLEGQFLTYSSGH